MFFNDLKWGLTPFRALDTKVSHKIWMCLAKSHLSLSSKIPKSNFKHDLGTSAIHCFYPQTATKQSLSKLSLGYLSIPPAETPSCPAQPPSQGSATGTSYTSSPTLSGSQLRDCFCCKAIHSHAAAVSDSAWKREKCQHQLLLMLW